MSDRYAAHLPATDRRETPAETFWNRRQIVRGLGLGAVALSGGAGVGPLVAQSTAQSERKPIEVPLARPDIFPAKRNPKYSIPKGIDGSITEREIAATHNNFYEFLPGRGGPVWQFTEKFTVEPWSLEVAGECDAPKTFDLDDLFGFAHEERLYHFRCVERWAMNVPWSGFPLRKLIEAVKPRSSAKYVRFVTAKKDDQMPGIRQAGHYDWPYIEALRIDEATHDLAFAVTGAYGEPLLKQHGAPIRIAVPWKYGYKNPKSIVRIELVKEEPKTFWQIQAHEYGFISNINPNIPHPRWSQATSYWLHDQSPFPTQIYNGYGAEVASLYPDEPTTPQTPLRPGQTAR